MKIDINILFGKLQTFGVFTLCVVLLAETPGCTKGSTEYCPGSDDKVSVTLSFSADGVLHASSPAAEQGRHSGALHVVPSASVAPSAAGNPVRALSTPSFTDETAVRDMWVLQYDMSESGGSLRSVRHVDEVLQQGASVYVRAELEPLANTRIVVVANDPGPLAATPPVVGSSLSVLNAMTFAVASATGGGIPQDDSGVLPMRGESADIKLEAGVPATVRIPLYRLVSKIRFTLDNRCAKDYPRLTVTAVALRKVPSVSSYSRIVESTHATVRFPEALPSHFTNYVPVTEGIEAPKSEFLWYMAPNSRGRGTATKPSDKTVMTAPDGQGAYCTYISVQGFMEQQQAGERLPMSYRIYLGGNSTDDYNLWANEAYTVRMTVNSLPDHPEVNMGYDGFEVEISGPGDDHDNPVEGWDNPSYDLGPGIDVEDTDAEHDNTVEGWGNN